MNLISDLTVIRSQISNWLRVTDQVKEIIFLTYINLDNPEHEELGVIEEHNFTGVLKSYIYHTNDLKLHLPSS